MCCRRGIFLTDALLGLILISVTAAMLSSTVGYHQKATGSLSASRAAARAAERVLSDLQLGQTPQASDQTLKWEIQPLKALAPRGQVWVEIRVHSRGKSASLTGMVPVGSVKGGAP